jgi:Ca-activated chloride channel family protein
VEEPFVPRLADPHEIVAGLDLSGLPVLEGFVLTYPKADAQMVLAAGEGEPLLIVRRYGLGRSAAFTSDFRARWGTRWITWPLFPQLTAQLTRWLQRPSPARELTTDLRTDEGNLVIDVDAEDGEGRFLNFLELGASIVLPEGEVRELEIPQVAPGRYQASLEAETGGPYIATIHGLSASSRLLPQTHGLIVPYAREYRKFDPDIGLLEQLAAATGGKMMDINDAQGLQDIYSNPDSQWLSVRDIGIWLILAAALLLAAEIAARRLVLPAGFFRRILRKLSPFQRAGRKIPDLDEISRLMEERQQAEREERAKRDIGFWYARKGRR